MGHQCISFLRLAMEGFANHLCGQIPNATAPLGGAHEAVQTPGFRVKLSRDAGLLETLRIRDALVAQRIEVCRDDQCGRKPRKVFCEQRAHVRRTTIVRVRHVRGEHFVDRRHLEVVSISCFAVRVPVVVDQIGRGDQQELEVDVRPSFVSRSQREGRGEVPTRAPAADSQPVRAPPGAYCPVTSRGQIWQTRFTGGNGIVGSRKPGGLEIRRGLRGCIPQIGWCWLLT